MSESERLNTQQTVQRMDEMANDLENEASRLYDLGIAFMKTGNKHVSELLMEHAHRLFTAESELRMLSGQVTANYVAGTEQATKNMMAAALGAAALSTGDRELGERAAEMIKTEPR